MSEFLSAAGTVIGRDHRRRSINNHDAWSVLSEEGRIAAVVTDGCGSGAHSEVGAQIGASLLTQNLLVTGSVPWAFLATQATLEQLAHQLTLRRDLQRVVIDYFLFTVVGVYITPGETGTATFFTLGDGVLAINGKIQTWDYPDNAPPYLGYGLLPEGTVSPEMYTWEIRDTMPTSDLHSFLIGSDGVNDLVRAQESPIPGKTELVGPLEQLWELDRYHNNPDAVRRFLALVGRDVLRSGEHGLLSDDTTLVVGRRSPLETNG